MTVIKGQCLPKSNFLTFQYECGNISAFTSELYQRFLFVYFTYVEKTMIEHRYERGRERLLKLLDEATKPLDINYIAEKLGLGWWPTYRLVTSLFLEEVQQHPEIMQKLSFVCLKSTKSVLVMSNRLLPKNTQGGSSQ